LKESFDEMATDKSCPSGDKSLQTNFTPLESPAACSGDEYIIPSGPEAF